MREILDIEGSYIRIGVIYRLIFRIYIIRLLFIFNSLISRKRGG